MVLVCSFHVAWVPITVGSDLLVGRGCGHGLSSRPLEASGTGFLDDLLLSLAIHLGPVSLLLMVHLGCGTVPPIFPINSLLGSFRLLVVWLYWLLRPRLPHWLLVCGALRMLLVSETLERCKEEDATYQKNKRS